MKRRLRVCTVAIGTILGLNLSAADATEIISQSFEGNHFQSGQFETSIGQGVLFSPFIVRHRPTLDYSLTEIQLGYMLTDISGANVLRGNLEVVGDAFGGGIFDGRGNYVSGGTFWLRYNFLPTRYRFVPFAQGGIGVTETDLDRRIEGENFNFNLNLGAGVRCFLTSNCSVNFEYRYQHISNAHLSRPNAGVNADGPVVSVSYFF